MIAPAWKVLYAHIYPGWWKNSSAYPPRLLRTCCGIPGAPDEVLLSRGPRPAGLSRGPCGVWTLQTLRCGECHISRGASFQSPRSASGTWMRCCAWAFRASGHPRGPGESTLVRNSISQRRSCGPDGVACLSLHRHPSLKWVLWGWRGAEP